MDESLLNINEVAEQTGLTPSVLRIWELRYKWPKPKRGKNTYRQYDAAIIDDLKWVKERLDQGKGFNDLIVDGKITRNRSIEVLPGSRKSQLDFSHILQPQTAKGQQLRQQLEEAIQSKNLGRVAYLEAESLRLPPAERQLAVVDVLAIARQQHASASGKD
jgi:DNA-binding transcriptional MerR regulator